ncbi:MAG: molybdopterin-dependent oxidoreductase [Ignavibacteriales bacterium]|nr:molybdopterin-dependent oxidoreductase [Ignavibacteriales bacterium]
MINNDTINHVRGISIFADDYREPSGTLHAAVFYSSIAAGEIQRVDYGEAIKSEGVVRILTYKDIPGENQIGSIIKDEPLFAERYVHYIGQPIALIVAKSRHLAIKARKKIEIRYIPSEVITDPREAFKKGSLIAPPRVFACGDTIKGFEESDVVIEGRVDSGGQEHLYIETQGALAIPLEGDNLRVISSTQGPTAVQRAIANVLGIGMHKIEVEAVRLGGGFGGKEDQATVWGVLSALAAYTLKTAVKVILPRGDDVKITGKRHPYSSDYKIGLSKDGIIKSYEVTFYQNSGAAADLSTAVLDRTLFHSTNSYFIPNVKATGIACKTNLVPNTAFRGFGGPQGMFVIESAIYKAAEKLKIPPHVIQEKNLISDGKSFPYGQIMINSTAEKCFSGLKQIVDLEAIKSETEKFNQQEGYKRRGFAIMPICFGISFTNTMLNQAASLVNIYTDGTVAVSTAAVEMGQGVYMKIRQVVARIFSIDISKVKTESTSTKTVANTSPTAASVGFDMNGKATEIASLEIKKRLTTFICDLFEVKEESVDFKDENILIGKEIKMTWKELISKAYVNRVSLCAQAHYATPGISFDPGINKGNPFAYYSFGSAMIEAEVDCLKGTYSVESVNIIHDFGESLNPLIDMGQAEGALMQGIGWMTMEEILFNAKGILLTNALSTYKVPDINYTPRKINIKFLENSPNIKGVMNSKAIGEPPLMYGIAVYFAILNAIKSFRNCVPEIITSPLTPERVLKYLYPSEMI